MKKLLLICTLISSASFAKTYTYKCHSESEDIVYLRFESHIKAMAWGEELSEFNLLPDKPNNNTVNYINLKRILHARGANKSCFNQFLDYSESYTNSTHCFTTGFLKGIDAGEYSMEKEIGYDHYEETDDDYTINYKGKCLKI